MTDQLQSNGPLDGMSARRDLTSSALRTSAQDRSTSDGAAVGDSWSNDETCTHVESADEADVEATVDTCSAHDEPTLAIDWSTSAEDRSEGAQSNVSAHESATSCQDREGEIQAALPFIPKFRPSRTLRLAERPVSSALTDSDCSVKLEVDKNASVPQARVRSKAFRHLGMHMRRVRKCCSKSAVRRRQLSWYVAPMGPVLARCGYES